MELPCSCEINILVVFSDIPVFCLDYKLPTTLNIEFVTVPLGTQSKPVEDFVSRDSCFQGIDEADQNQNVAKM